MIKVDEKTGCIEVLGNRVDADTVRLLRENGEIAPMDGIGRDGEKCRFQLAYVNGEIVVRYLDCTNRLDIQCPVCGKQLLSTAKVYKCSGKSCNFFLYKESSGIIFDHSMIRRLFAGESVETESRNRCGFWERVNLSMEKGVVEKTVIL